MSWRQPLTSDLQEEEEEEAGAAGELFQLADSVLELELELFLVVVVEVVALKQL